ncbi:alpha/beta hydrolase [Methanocella sp. CWC-04]|uniref:Alpha/beta hydrolase n=1 Tax=Methanooceanicella nereidis TaxID=2052831 RepID=A0AAP2RFC0_9EURY|nr:alpha/beta hydrolase [Methanocella sp. CWC-04]MCD1295075.1 alpha/beta hydrolase [Methanocella sp. CWC-04]
MGVSYLINIRKYGNSPFTVAVVHGGPGAPGELAPVAKELSLITGTLEPLQTSASIAGQIQELHDVLKEHGDLPLTLIGHSWGAWLSLMFAARYPIFVKKLILIGSGPFEERYASKIMETRLNRMNEEERSEVRALTEALNDPCTGSKAAALSRLGKLMSKSDSFETLPDNGEEILCQDEIFQSVWNEAKKIRQSGDLLKIAEKLRCPVIAIHGDYDPHPYEGVEKPLSRILNDFRFILLKNCGHEPWKERAAKDRFYLLLNEELI